ncbi:MAG: translation elongation factor Ts [Elusimicrobiaceae bacterium]|nr:translation elongation factor Ts [Elusimicrobiaceae bacterium]
MMDKIKSLRDATGAGIMACKSALIENNGDFDKAVEYLRKKGLAAAQKRAGRETSEGCTRIKTDARGMAAALLNLGCETDFVAKTDDFKSLADRLVEHLFANPGVTAEDEKLKAIVLEVAPKLGEHIDVKKAEYVKVNGKGALSYYIHTDNKKAAIVELQSDTANVTKLQELGKELALQAVAMTPSWVHREEVPASVIESEKDIYRTQAANEGKPAAAIEKMLEGRLRKFYEQNCLLDQISIRDSKKTVSQFIAEAEKELGAPVKVARVERVG